MVLNCNIREYTRKKPLIEKNKENIFLFVFKISILIVTRVQFG